MVGYSNIDVSHELSFFSIVWGILYSFDGQCFVGSLSGRLHL